MHNAFFRLICRILIVSLAAMPLQLRAGPIGTDAVAQAPAARDSVKGFLQRAEVAGQLQALGLTAQAAQQRVDALNDHEILKLAGQIDSLPAGGNGIGVGFVIIVLFLLWRFYLDPSLAESPKSPGKPAPGKEAPKK
jgi:hypothetical protein